MTTSINELPALDPESRLLKVVIDTPKGSRNKYKFDELLKKAGAGSQTKRAQTKKPKSRPHR
jgi:inorganic pyrophosphatase